MEHHIMMRRLLRRFHTRRDVAYDENFFPPSWFDNWRELSGVLKALIISRRHWRSVVDFGCGPGAMIDLMNDSGIHYVGCERSPQARALYLKHYGRYSHMYVTDLADVDLPRMDVALSWDVSEHLTDEEARTVLRTMTPTPEIASNISRTKGLPGHINIKNDAQWIKLFGEAGLTLDVQGTRALRDLYKELRPKCPDAWDKNIFLLKSA
jgi:SAM-dependent methyltransferase